LVDEPEHTARRKVQTTARIQRREYVINGEHGNGKRTTGREQSTRRSVAVYTASRGVSADYVSQQIRSFNRSDLIKPFLTKVELEQYE
jgi:hypothetical protein